MRTARRFRAHAVGILYVVVASGSAFRASVAQMPAAPAPSYALEDVIGAMRAGAAIVRLDAAAPEVALRLDRLESYFGGAHALGLSLDDLTTIYTRRSATVRTVARWNSARVAPAFADSLASLNKIAFGQLEQLLRTALTADSLGRLYAPIDEFRRRVQLAALASNQERLRRFAQKYGPSSPQLNLAEVALNYAAQLTVPGFLPDDAGAPSPYEIVATYRTTDLTAARGSESKLTARVVSTAQLGVRKYSFKEGCGIGSRFADLLSPCQSSLGVFMMGPDDAPLRRVWGSGNRAGLYAARGKYHLGFVALGGGRRVVVGVDQQLVPFTF